MNKAPYFSNPIIGNWLDLLSSTLSREAEVAGVFDHNASAGTARERILSSVLSRILPASCEIGTGQILFHEGGLSPQVDIIIFDGSCPRYLSEAGFGVYPAEGVIAAIEVKSTLDKTSLYKALDQLASIMPPSVNIDGGRFFYPSGTLSSERHSECHMPLLYLFAYKSKFSLNAAYDVTKKFLADTKEYNPNRWLMLPACACAGSFSGLMCLPDMNVEFCEDDMSTITSECGECKPLYGWCRHDRSYSQFIAHVAYYTTMRLAHFDVRTGVRNAPETSLPLEYAAKTLTGNHQKWMFVKQERPGNSWADNIVDVEANPPN